MKTSNKLLLVLFLAIFFSAASLMVYAKSHMVIGNNINNHYYGEENVIEKVLLQNLDLDSIEMGDNFVWEIDPNSTEVIIKGDSTFISYLKVVNDDQFRILTGGVPNNYHWENNVYVTVGVKNLKSLNLKINGNASVTASDLLSNNEIDMDIDGNGKCFMELDTDNLNIDANGNGNVSIKGDVGDMKAKINGNKKLNFEHCNLGFVELNANGNSRFYGDEVQAIDGHASGNAKIRINKVMGSQSVSTSGNGRFTIRN